MREPYSYLFFKNFGVANAAYCDSVSITIRTKPRIDENVFYLAMSNPKIYPSFPIILLIALAVLNLGAQESETDTSTPNTQPQPQSPAITQEKVVKLIEVKKLISKEAANWEMEKQQLTDLVELRKKEIEKVAEIVERSQQRITDVEEKSNALDTELKQRETWRKDFGATVTALEDSLIENLGFLPPPVVGEVSDAIERLKDRKDTEEDLQTRFRDIAAILNECTTFNAKIHTYTEVREVEGERLEVEVLYMGMHQAWFVDRNGKRAGVGVPSKDGWVWQSVPSIAAQVRKTIDIQAKRESPEFVKLPFSNGKTQ